MIRRAFTMRLKPDSLAEYKRHHDNIWPELVAEIERSGIASITTFQRDLDLFLVSEIADEAAWDKLWNSEVHRRWAELMQPLMHLSDNGIVEAGQLNEVFHLTINDNGQVAVVVETVEPADELIAEATAEVEAALEQLELDAVVAAASADQTPPPVAAEPVEPARKKSRRKAKKSAAKKAAGKKKPPAKKVHRKKAAKAPPPKTVKKAKKKASKKSAKKKSAPKKAKKTAKKKSAKKKR